MNRRDPEGIEPDSSARKPAWHRSLAWRLATLYLLTTLSILLALGAALYLLTRYTVYQRLDAELAAQADFYAAYAGQLAASEGELAILAPSLVRLFSTQADLNVRVFAANSGALLAATQEIGAQPSQAALQALAYRSPTLFVQPSRDLPGRRYAARAILSHAADDDTVRSPTNGRPGFGRPSLGVVEVSRSTLANERTLASLGRILAFAALLAVLLTLLASVLLARRLSRPIRDVKGAAQRIAAGDLQVRLEERGPDELQRLAASINRMARQLHDLETSRAQFISEIAHDLRTPLAAVKGLLVNQIDAADKPEPALVLAEQETDRLIRLVNQLLDLARWQGGQLTLNRRPTDLCALASRIVALYQPRANHRKIELKAVLDPDVPHLLVDPDRLERAMLNLIDNALRFTPGGGKVTLAIVCRPPCAPGTELGSTPEDARQAPNAILSADRGPTSKGEVEVSVLDTGRGMTQAEQQRIHEAYRDRLGRRQAGGAPVGRGTGLGLTITQAVVRAHGGRLGIQSPVDVALKSGTRVWFTLPL